MGDEVESTDGGPARAVSRRNVLKGAVAAGVGVAAWTAPNISTLGGTPAYALVCTGPVTTQVLGSRNTSCNCGNPPTTKFVNYKPPTTSQCGSAVAGTFLASHSCATAVGSSGDCDMTNGGGAGICTSPAAGQFCKGRAIVQTGNCTGTEIATAETGIIAGPGQGFSYFAAIDCGSFANSSNIFVRFELICAFDSDCL